MPEGSDTPPHRYTAALAGQIEARWQGYWAGNRTFATPNPGEPGFDPSRPKQYILDMFPYPSGVGLHVGHPLGYIATDIYARYLRMTGHNVLHAMGFDAFGLPAEQFAVQTNTHPRITTERNIATMRTQLARLGLAHDPRRSVSTTDPGFVKWTQWIFLKMYESWYDREPGAREGTEPGAQATGASTAFSGPVGRAPGSAARARPIAELIPLLESGARATRCGRPWAGLSEDARRAEVDLWRLAYLAEAPVNWCPGLGTVLANEEVIDGRSERGNFPVFRRPLKQWMMRITDYAERLAADLDTVAWPEPIKIMQRNWIGRSEGALIDFVVPGGPSLRDGSSGFPGTPPLRGGSSDLPGTPPLHGGSLALPGTPESAAERRGTRIRVFTTRPDTLFGATYMVLSPEHPLVDQIVADTWDSGAGFQPVGADTRGMPVPPRWKGSFPGAPADGYATPRDAVAAYRGFAASRTDAQRTESKDKTGVFTGAWATNPATGKPIPVFIADYVLMGYGTGAIMAVPGQDERDWEFAERYALPIVRTVRPPEGWEGTAYTGEGPAVESGFLNGLPIAEAKARMGAWLRETGHGEPAVTYKLRDWLFSRQRYWGEPFPIVFDERGVAHPLPESMLPLLLPELENFKPESSGDPDAPVRTPLGRAADWVHVTLDLGDGPREYVRETNTMPNWAGSCWYYLRYLDPDNEQRFVGRNAERYWMVSPRADGTMHAGGVDLYVGGVEHAVLHLLYARFWHKVLFDLGQVSTPEPFGRLFNQGYIQAAAYTDARGAYVPADEVQERAEEAEVEVDRLELSGGEVEPLRRSTKFFWKGEPVFYEYGKMGKALKNAVAPDAVCEQYGCDTLRVYEMYMGPLEASKPWNPRDIVGAFRFLQRAWRALIDEETGRPRLTDAPPPRDVLRALHKTIAGVRGDCDRLAFNTAIAKLIEFTNDALSGADAVPREVARAFVLMLAPLAPHMAEELWSRLGLGSGSLAYEPFPVADTALAADDELELPVSVNGKVRGHVRVPAAAAPADIEAAALAEPKVQEWLAGKTVKKVIVVPKKMVNVVAA
ncbi:MAG: leucine--tRNA ligase [Phycisphaerales bacterium]|nr:leucine--tRNA ligase [Phycisphaerales bacterium]